ncbi:type I 3-dehydroquinate dehydratase [Paenibacillus sp. JX-17]|uniref:3-dehydroquinate dehydratase n=1 Tax=Paenibacillus lacisoli TaxID=3064525 RepID=A0ABT9CEC0_9BACL|nr:type I 3-dehydroquinate dehydratase [Paenibacillus sp. JX-17]MDO7907623.1 type I 3-dehydroquinate dehydratase [Paenibacillus sp. JX-17]
MTVQPLTIRDTVIGEGAPKVIIPLTADTETGLLEEAADVLAMEPDLIEWRADLYQQVEDLEAVNQLLQLLRDRLGRIPLLFTFRTHKEGGSREFSDRAYADLLHAVIRSGQADLIDVELFSAEEDVKAVVDAARERGVIVVMSNHDFQATPPKDEIIARLRRMQDFGAHIPKLACMPASPADVLTLLDATHTMRSQYADRPFLTMSMGGQGLISRMAGELFGSALTFAAGRTASAPGQIPAPELKQVLDILHRRR